MFNITPTVRTLIIINVVIFVLHQFFVNLYTVELSNGQSMRIGLTEFMSLWSMNPHFLLVFLSPINSLPICSHMVVSDIFFQYAGPSLLCTHP